MASKTAAFIVPKLSVDDFSTRFQYVHHILPSVSCPVLVNNPLLFDADLDGHLDVFGANLAGKIYGVLNFNCMLQNCEIKQWDISVPHNSFPNSPIMVPMNRRGDSLIAFISHQAGIFAFDSSGKLSAQLQIPNLRVVLGSKSKSVYQSTPAVESIEWSFSNLHINSSTEKGVHLLQPHVFADAIHHTVPLSASMGESELLDQPTLIIPVTFASPRQHLDATVIHVTAIVAVSRRVLLLGNQQLTSLRQSSAVGLQIQVLEVTEQVASAHHHQPTLLVSAPVVVVTGSVQEGRPGHPSAGRYLDSPDTSHSVLVTTTTGHLHRLPLPLTGIDPGHFWQVDRAPLPHSCLILQCPRSNSSKQVNLCCLLLDASSRLHLVELTRPGEPPRSRFRLATVPAGQARIRWQYNATGKHHFPPPFGEDDETRTQVTLVPACISSSNSSSSCSTLAIFPGPNGLVHAVDATTGASVPGYPLRLFHPQRPPTKVTFAAGSGQLSLDASGAPWIIYSDSRGRLYHICVLKATVEVGTICATSRHASPTCYEEVPSDQMTSVRMSPLVVPTGRQVEVTSVPVSKLADRSPVKLLLWNDRGLQLLVMSSNVTRVAPHVSVLTSSVRAPAEVNRSPLFPVPLFDIWLESTSRSGDTMAYHVYNFQNAATAPGDYLITDKVVGHPVCYVRLLDAMGLPFSDWSTSTTDDCQSHGGIEKSTNEVHCCGHLVMNQIAAYWQTHIVNSATLMVLRGDPSLVWTSSSDTLNSAQLPILLVDAESVQLQATLLLLIYLPAVILLFGLSTLHIFSSGDFIKRSDSGKRPLNSA